MTMFVVAQLYLCSFCVLGTNFVHSFVYEHARFQSFFEVREVAQRAECSFQMRLIGRRTVLLSVLYLIRQSPSQNFYLV